MIARNFIYLFLLFSPVVFAAQTKTIDCPRLLRKLPRPVFFTHADGWLGMNIRYEPAEQLRHEVEKRLRKPLLNRGEAHITILTPDEYKKIANVLAPERILEIAEQLGSRSNQVMPDCIGRGEAKIDGKTEQTYYVVARAPVLSRIRHAIQREFLGARGNPNDFKPTHFFPHITLGFTSRDLYEQDGVIKNSDSCVYSLNTK